MKSFSVFTAAILLLLFLSTNSFAIEVAIVKSKDIEPYNLSLKGFKEIIKEANFQEYDIEGDIDKGISVVKQIKSNSPDLILGLGAKATYLVNHDINDIPIVFSMLSNPERYNISGKNVTGVKLDIPLEKRLRLYKEIMPDIKKIGVIFSSDRLKKLLDRARPLLKEMKIELIAERVHEQKDIPAAMDRIVSSVDAICLLFDPVVTSSPLIVKEIIIFNALKNRIPVVGFNKWSVTAGALFTLYSEYEDVGRQTGRIAYRIINKTGPSLIPVESPDEIRVFFNDKIIKRVSLKVRLNIPDNAYIWRGN